MTNILTANNVVLTAATTKGDLGNKISAGVDTLENNIAGVAQTAAALAVGGATIAVANKYQPVRDTLVKGIDATAKPINKALAKFATALKSIKVNPKLKLFANKTANMFKNNPAMKKIGFVTGALTLFAIGLISKNMIYQQGKIDQKHEIIANLQKKTKLF